MAANRVVEVNRALRARGEAITLRRGRGYYYFAGGDAALWPSSGVYVYRASDLTVAEWLHQFDLLSTAR